MTPTQLRAFHLVAEQGSFSAAARASGLSQPNLSGQVTALEKAYGVHLFDRRGRSVTPTETGRQLHGVTTRLFALNDEARALLAGEQALTRGHLRIAADSAHHVVPIMAALRKRAGGLTFSLSIDNSAVVLERLLRHEADVAVMAKSVSDPRLHALRLRTDRVVLFSPTGHPLAKKGRVPLTALNGQELVRGGERPRVAVSFEQAPHAAAVMLLSVVVIKSRSPPPSPPSPAFFATSGDRCSPCLTLAHPHAARPPLSPNCRRSPSQSIPISSSPQTSCASRAQQQTPPRGEQRRRWVWAGRS